MFEYEKLESKISDMFLKPWKKFLQDFERVAKYGLIRIPSFRVPYVIH